MSHNDAARRFLVKPALLAGLALLAIIAAALYWWEWRKPAPAGPPAQAGAKGGKYSDLTPEQARLVDDWVDRFSKVMGKTVRSETLYDELALSTRTTFNAVTHALLKTRLTDASGQPMNMTALDLVARVENVAGRIPGKGGDKQFRMYVGLKPNALQVLGRCREFTRQRDNTVYHKGYPTCFRGAGGTPSIQFSLSRDATRGDIDVDYRASSFPVMLVNGHLTASNSDVRAGDNDQRHNGHWSGLTNWWRGFMGLPLFEFAKPDLKVVGSPVASEPRLGRNARPEEAIHDFLNSWLVEQNPGVAAGYFSPRAFACMEVERGVPVDRGLARLQMFRAMQAANQLTGKASRLSDVIEGVSLSGPRGKAMEQPHHSSFVMYDVREDLAEQFDCENKLHPELADPRKAHSEVFGKYIGAVFQLKTAAVKGEMVATIWAKGDSGWLLVSYDVEPEFKRGAPPAAPEAATASEPALQVVDGDPSMTRAATEFLEAWYVRKDAAAAFSYLSPKCFPCYNVFRPENLPQASGPQEAGKLIRERMGAVAEWAGRGALEEVLVAVEPHHPDLKIVRHDRATAFSIVSVPDVMAASADCANLRPGELPHVEWKGSNTYGRHYAVSTRLKRAGEDAAVLWTLWSREGAQWRVVSYLVLTP